MLCQWHEASDGFLPSPLLLWDLFTRGADVPEGRFLGQNFSGCCNGGPVFWSGFFNGEVPSKEEDRHDFQKFGQEHTRPSFVDRSDGEWWSDGVPKMTCCYSINCYMYIYVHISSCYTQNCVHQYRKCLCRVYAYARYSTKKLIDLEFLSDVWCNFQFLCIFYMWSLKYPPPTQLPGDKDASVPPGAMQQCGMCDLFGQRWRLHAVVPQAGPIHIYSDLELIRWKTAFNFVCCILFIVLEKLKMKPFAASTYLSFFKYLNGFWELNPLVHCMCLWLIAIELFFTTFMN